MNITVFTSNQPRHVALISRLADIADTVYAVQECTTLFPGSKPDFYKKTEVMRRYFARVVGAERAIFGEPTFSAPNVNTLSVKHGDVNDLKMDLLAPALESDYYIVFGSSYLKGPLCDFIISKSAVNIHMGISPFYRGNGCNFWALYDDSPQYVGATIHMLSAGLDSGEIIFHALPAAGAADPFDLGMLAVNAAIEGLCSHLRTEELLTMTRSSQDKTREIRYTRNADFNDAVASEYLSRSLSPSQVATRLAKRSLSDFHNPFVAG